MKRLSFLLICLTATFFANAQNVGIGTTTPLTTLHIRNGISGATPNASSPLAVESNVHTYINLLSPAAYETAILFGQPGSSANGGIMYNNGSTPNGFQFRNNGNITRMVIDNTGNVGIGTSSPLDPLHVNGVSLFTPGGSNIQILDGNKIQAYANGGLNLTTFSDDPIKFTTFTSGGGSGGERMRILSNGNVGIGTTSPTASLHVNGVSLFTPGGSNIQILDGNKIQAFANGGLNLTTYSDDPIRFTTYTSGGGSGGERMRILSNGNVGIGTSNPNAPLGFPAALGKKITLFPGGSGDVGMAVQGNLLQIYSDNPSADIAFGYDVSGTMTERMRIKGNGNVGIGTTTPAASLDVNGYTKLGSDAPSIKMKKLTGTTASTEGGVVSIVPGVDYLKILSVSILVSNLPFIFPANISGSGNNFNWIFDTLGRISVGNVLGDSANILSKPIKILITYEE